MKKTLLIGAAIAVGLSAFGQGQRQAANLKNHSINKGANKVDAEAFPVAGTKKIGGPTATTSVCIPDPFTSGPNAFGVGGGVTTYKQNCLSYNQDLNAYVYTHRRSQEWVFPGRTSGAIQSTWLNVATGMWDSTLIYRDSLNAAGGRYPNGTFYNPALNTNIANVWVVGTGPALPGGGFAGGWYSARKLTGTTADQTVLPANATQNVDYAVAPQGVFGSSLFPNTDAVQVGTKVLVGGDIYDTTTSANPNHIAGFGGIIGKADFSGGGAPVWSKDSVMPGYYFNRDGAGCGYATDNEGSRLAFFGQIGYWMGQGRLATNYNNSADSMLSPIVYKTTDGGATWAPILQGYDWACRHPELGWNVGDLRGGTRHFGLNYRHGIDMTVDANGKLHLVGTFLDPYLDGASVDSLAFTYTYNHDYVDNHPIMWDLVTDGTDWKTMMIDSIITAYVGADPSSDTTAAFSAVANGATFLNYGARLQVSRSSDGTTIFYSWADSDPSVTGTPFNSQPDLWMKAYNITTGLGTVSTNVTNGIGTCFFHNMADVAYFDATQTKWVCPMVYTLPRVQPSPGVYDGVSPSDHIWVNCGAFGVADFTAATVWNNEGAACVVGIKTVSGTFVNAVNAYPNPSTGVTNIVVSLNEGKAINVNVYDAIGNVVFSKKMNGNIGENTIVFDGSNLSAGVYHYTVSAGYDAVTKKLVIQK